MAGSGVIYMLPRDVPGHLDHGRYGAICTPPGRSSALRLIERGARWICDNGAFSGRFNADAWARGLARLAPYRETCIAVVVPDVVADHAETARRFVQYAPGLIAAGWRVAFVAQDGMTERDIPPECSTVFIGGSTDWKMGAQALAIIAEAKRQGKWVHIGRVNTLRRWRHFQLAGADSADGTALAFGFDANWPILEKMTRQLALMEVQ